MYTGGADDRLSFRQATPHQVDVKKLVLEIGFLSERWLSKQGYSAGEESESDPEDTMALLQAASLEGLEAVGPRAGKKVRRVRTFRGREVALPPRCAGYEGYNLHAGVSLKSTEREALERLLWHTLRPPLAKERLTLRDGGRTVVLEMKRVWSDGTQSLEFSRADFVGKLAALVPPPKSNQTVYHGVLAGNSAFRASVVPAPPALTRKERWRRRSRKLCPGPRRGFGSGGLICSSACLVRTSSFASAARGRCGSGRSSSTLRRRAGSWPVSRGRVRHRPSPAPDEDRGEARIADRVDNCALR